MKRVLCVTDHARVFGFTKQVLDEHGVDADWMTSPFGAEAGIPLPMIDLKDEETIREIERKYDVVFSMHCKQIFPPQLVKAVRCINMHPGVNPYNRGWFPSQFSIMNGMPAGVTIHEIDEGIDSGPIITRCEVPVEPWDTSESVYEKIMVLEEELIDTWIDDLVDGRYQTQPAPVGNYNSRVDHESMCALNMEEPMTMGQAINRLRALTHGDYRNARFYVGGRRVWVRISFEVEEPHECLYK